MRTSSYWLHFLTNCGGDFNNCRIGGHRYVGAGSMSSFASDWSELFVHEILATFVYVFCIVLMTTVLHESADTNYGPLVVGAVIAGTSYALGLVFPAVHFNPNITLYVMARTCMSTASTARARLLASETGELSPGSAQREWVRVLLCVLMRSIQIGCQLVGSMLAAIVIYHMDYVRHLQRVALQNSASYMTADSYYLNLGQTVPNSELEIGEMNAYALEFVGTVFLMMVLRHTLTEGTKFHLDTVSSHTASAAHERQHGHAHSAWRRVYTNVAMPVVLALTTMLFGRLTGGSMNWARSFGPAWYVDDMWSQQDGTHATDSNTYNGYSYLVGYILSQTIAVVVVVMVDVWSMWLKKRKLCHALNVPEYIMIGLRDKYHADDCVSGIEAASIDRSQYSMAENGFGKKE